MGMVVVAPELLCFLIYARTVGAGKRKRPSMPIFNMMGKRIVQPHIPPPTHPNKYLPFNYSQWHPQLSALAGDGVAKVSNCFEPYPIH